MKRTHFLLAFSVILILAITTSFCAAQTSETAIASDTNQVSTQTTQDPAKPSPVPDQTQTPDKDKDKDKPKVENQAAGTSKDRLFFALPNFLTVENAGNVPPLTAGGKFKVVARGSFDPIQLVWYGALSSICQADNCEPGFGQGWAAYGKRYGSYAADGTIENFFVGAIFPSMLHQDPRFFPKAEGSFMNRAWYGVSRIIITRTDAGNRQFNYSEIFGAAAASAISTYSYHPHPGYHPGPGVEYIASDRTLKNTASVWGSQVGYDTITLVVKEFWPDIRRKLKK